MNVTNSKSGLHMTTTVLHHGQGRELECWYNAVLMFSRLHVVKITGIRQILIISALPG